MSEHRAQNHDHTINLDDYEAAKPFKATLADIKASLSGEVDDEPWGADRVGQFTLRLLDRDGSGAFERFMQIVATDKLSDEPNADALVSARPLTRETAGRLESHVMTAEGMLINSQTGDERGYFVGGQGLGGDELGSYTMQQRLPREEPVEKAIALELPQI